jgi:hypothetical protein
LFLLMLENAPDVLLAGLPARLAPLLVGSLGDAAQDQLELADHLADAGLGLRRGRRRRQVLGLAPGLPVELLAVLAVPCLEVGFNIGEV